MLYLWRNCRSLSLCSPNLFYILLWLLVLSRPLQQLLLRKRGGKKKKRQVHIDQDLQVYCRDSDLFQRVFLFGWKCFTHLSKAPRIQQENMSCREKARLVFQGFLCLRARRRCKVNNHKLELMRAKGWLEKVNYAGMAQSDLVTSARQADPEQK